MDSLPPGNSSAPGNIALWDQKLAIKWVKDNIQSFGGNPNVITLFGQGAGWASVILQSLHAPNQGLFHKIIAQSGVATSPTYFTNKTVMVNTSIEFAVIAGCYTAGTPKFHYTHMPSNTQPGQLDAKQLQFCRS